jgi:hypothetical protein
MKTISADLDATVEEYKRQRPIMTRLHTEISGALHNGGYFVEWDNEADLSADPLYLEGTPCEQGNKVRTA